MAKGSGASLDPNTHQGGGQVPPGTYDITKARAAVFTYPGQGAQVPAILVTYRDAGVDYEQMYKAGDLDHLVPSDDGERFVHPRGESAAIYKGGAASLFLASLAKQGFQFTGDRIPQIEGIRVDLDNVAAPKGKTSDNPDKVIPLVMKIHPKGKSTTTRPTVAAAPNVAGTSPSATVGVLGVGGPSNGDVSKVALGAVLCALSSAPDYTLKVKGLAVRCLKFAPGTKLNDLTKTITPEWLAAQTDVTGWNTDGESVNFPGLDPDTLKAVLETL